MKNKKASKSKRSKKKNLSKFILDDTLYQIGDKVIVEYPWLKKQVVAEIMKIDEKTHNVDVLDIKRQFFRGFNYKTLKKHKIKVNKIINNE
jgi:hypothetical protein